MATKAELEAELAELRAKLSQQEEPPELNKPLDEQPQTDGADSFADLLKEHGVDSDQIDVLWNQFSKELGDIPLEKPLLTAIAAFGLGFALGRLTKT